MEELLGNAPPAPHLRKEPTKTSIYSGTGRKSSIGNNSSVASFRSRPEKRTSVQKKKEPPAKNLSTYGAMFSDDDGVDSDDDLISDILTSQKKGTTKTKKTEISSDLDELLGLANGDSELDDLENLLSHG